MWLMVLFLIVSTTDGCRYDQYMEIGKTYYVYNDRSNGDYFNPPYDCEWVATSPVNSKIVLSCNVVELYGDCYYDKFLVNLGSTTKTFCGRTTVYEMSSSNYLSVRITSNYNRGLYTCTITALSQGPAPPPINPVDPTPSCDCGMKQQKKIVGGTETGKNEYPFMALIIRYPDGKTNTYETWCGATIISQYHAVTAAHCFERPSDTYALLVGDHDISNLYETNSELYGVQKIQTHYGFDSSSFANDIAVVFTQVPIKFSINVGAVCLPYNKNAWLTDGTLVKMLGWGVTEFSGTKSNVLREVDVNIYNLNNCAAQFTKGSSIDQRNICTYSKGKDACQYDSGGPVLLYDWTIGRYFLVGIISFGSGCASSLPAVNTNVYQFINWIESTTGVNFCKK